MPANYNPLLEREKEIERAKKADKFWSAFLLTENGKVKSTLLLNSFCMCVVLIFVYAACFFLLLTPLQKLTQNAPTFIGNLAGAVIPALVGSLVCLLTFPLFKEKRTLPYAYVWLLVLALACLITMVILLWGEKGATLLLMQFFLLFLAAPLVFGCVGSLVLYKHWLVRHPRPADPGKEAKKW